MTALSVRGHGRVPNVAVVSRRLCGDAQHERRRRSRQVRSSADGGGVRVAAMAWRSRNVLGRLTRRRLRARPILLDPHVAPPARTCADAVQHHAHEHRPGHRGHGPPDLGCGRSQLLDRQQGEHDRGEPPRTEPSDEHHAGPVESRAHEAERHREHADDRQAGDGVHDGSPVEIVDRERDERRAEQEPDDQPEELAAERGELDRRLAVDDLLVEHRSEGDAGDEGGQEAVGVEGQGHDERGDRRRPAWRAVGRCSSIQPCRAAVEISSAPPIPTPIPVTIPPPSARSAAPISIDRLSLHDAELARRHRQHEHHDRGGDAVVEPALDVERPPYAQWDALVVDHLDAEGGVRRSERGTHEAGERPRQADEHPPGEETAEDHRQHEADRQQPDRDREIAPELRQVHPHGVGEQHEGQRHLGHDVDGGRVDVDGQRSPVRVRQQVPGDREHERPGDVVSRQRARHGRPSEHQQRQHCDGRLGHGVIFACRLRRR